MPEITIKTPAQYQQAAIRTMKPDDRLMGVLHCTMGMAGEAGEYFELPSDSPKKVGEIGDCFWYSATLSHIINVPFEAVMLSAEARAAAYEGTLSCLVPVNELVIHAARLTDFVKKGVFYGKELPDGELLGHLINYCSGLVMVCADNGFNVLDVMTANIRKLASRYPDKFDAEKAQARDYVAESKAAGVEIA